MIAANSERDPRSMAKRTGRGGRRLCRINGCPRKVTHLGLAGGVAMMCGCEWHVRRWVKYGARACIRVFEAGR